MKDLKEIADKNPFKVPDNYFEEVNSRIISTASAIEPATKSGGLMRRMRPLLAVAASLALLILLSYTVYKIFIPSEKNMLLSEISLSEFSDSYLNDIDILTLEEGFNPAASFDRLPEISNSEIIDYLLVEDIDLSDIYEIL